MKKVKEYKLDGKDYLDLWKYCEEVAGKDKDRMVTISTWLLAFGVAILAYIFTRGFQSDSFSIKEYGRIQVLFPAFAGMIICVFAGYLICAYSAYANRYWFMADWLEKEKIEGLSEIHKREAFLAAIKAEKSTTLFGGIQQRIIGYLTKSTLPTQGIIGVFKAMLYMTFGLFLLFVVIFVFAIVLAIVYGK